MTTKSTLLSRSLAALAGATLVTALFGGAASAAPKYERKQSPKLNIKVKQTGLTRGLKENTAKGKSNFVPEVTADEFMHIQGQVKFIRAQQIAEYRRLIEETDKTDPELPDLLFRLAEQYAQQQRYWHFRSMEALNKADSAPRNKKGQLKAASQRYHAEENKYLTEAIKIYALIANTPRFKNYPRMDEALFYYAYTLQGAKRVALSRKVYRQLIQDYPNSKFIPFAYLAFADYFFDSNQLAEAEKFYNKVLEFPHSPIYPYALYKKGWVYLNLNRSQDALETFYNVAQKTRGVRRYKQIFNASIHDFVRAYADVGRPQKAYQAFQRVDRKNALKMLKILATIYLDQGKAEKTIYTHRELISLAPRDPEVCDWQYNIVQAMITAGNNEQKTEEIENLVKLYVKYKGKGIIKGSSLEECRDNAQGTTFEMAALWHQEVMKTLNFDTLAYVERLYNLYLKAFPRAEHHAEVQKYFAECLWLRAENEQNPRVATERWEKAGVAFTDVVKAHKLPPAMMKDSAYAAVLAWKNALDVDPRTKVAENNDDLDAKEDAAIPKPEPITPREQKMLDAFDIYINYIKDPHDDELVSMKFIKARILWTHNHFKEALPTFYEIVDRWPKHDTARYSAAIIRDSLIRLHRYDELNTFVKKMLARNDFWDDRQDLKDVFIDTANKTRRKVAEQLEKEGKHLKCGLAYQEIFNSQANNPQAKGLDEVLYNAGVCFEDAKSIGLAITMYAQLQARYPKSTHAQKALARMGNAYGAIAWYDRSASAYEQFAKKYGGEKEAPAALQNAVTYRKGIGDDSQAVKDIEFFLKQYSRKMRSEAADAEWGLYGIYEKQNNDRSVIKALERYLHDMGARGGKDRVVMAHARIGQIYWEESCRGKGVDDACVKIERQRAIRHHGKRRHHGTVLPERCGEASKIKLTVLPRDRSLVGKARSQFRQAISAYGHGVGAKDPSREAVAIYWYAASKFYLAEELYEDFLSVKFPEKLDFNPRNARKMKESKKRFLKFMAEKSKKGEKANDAYKSVREIKGGGAAWAIAAAARIGQISQNAADALYTAEVPKQVRTGPYAEDAWDAYCDALTEQAAPLEERSVAGFTFCLNVSTQLNWFNKWSKLCERELGQIRPQDFPTASEVHADPDEVRPITDTQALVSTLQK